MGQLILGVGDYGASNKPGEVIKTFALGSCVAVIFYDPVSKMTGMVHVALPDSTSHADRAKEKPGYFADTGIPILLRQMDAVTAGKRNGLVVKLAGGASVMDPNGVFSIGKKNALAIKKILWGSRLGAVAEEIGGNISRTVHIEVDTGKVVIQSAGRGSWEI